MSIKTSRIPPPHPTHLPVDQVLWFSDTNEMPGTEAGVTWGGPCAQSWGLAQVL